MCRRREQPKDKPLQKDVNYRLAAERCCGTCSHQKWDGWDAFYCNATMGNTVLPIEGDAESHYVCDLWEAEL
jgi:hypothetical protein